MRWLQPWLAPRGDGGENIHRAYTMAMVPFAGRSYPGRDADVNSIESRKESPMKMLAAAVVLSAVIAAPAFAQSKEYNGPPARARTDGATDQIIVKWRSGAMAVMADPAAQRASKLSSAAGVTIQHKRRSTADTEVYKLSRAMKPTELKSVLDSLNADPDVAFAVADQLRRAHAVPTDPLYANQWYFQTVQPAATRAETAWDTTTGSAATIVAVLDTGVRFEHPDLGRVATGGKLLDGYDFVTRMAVANDGGARDSDASDPGDWVTTADLASPEIPDDCDTGGSSWHGTRVSSLIGALTNNSDGLAGTGWTTQLLPVRVLGKCGGFDSDIIDGMRWAAGLPVVNVPDNTTPAQIINLSLGGGGACNDAYQAAVNEITAQGSLIIASAGNDGGVVSAPANCDNVLGVTALRHIGTKVGFSNIGPQADIGAPGGNCVNTGAGQPCLFPILAATNSGTTVPADSGYTDPGSANVGTSFSAPLVAGAAALVHAVNPSLTPTQIGAVLKGSATPFPTTSTTPNTAICRTPTTNTPQGDECICTTSTCGSGMLNTASAVSAAVLPFGVVQAPSTLTPNVSVAIDGSTSFDADGTPIASSSYQWSIVDATGPTPVIANPTAAATTLQVTGDSRFTLRLRVTGAGGVTDDTDVVMVATTPIPPATTPIGSGGGGGGSFDWWLLVLGLLPLALPGPRRRKAVRVRGRSAPRTPLTREINDAIGSTGRSHRRRRRQHFPQ
jgi:serine protease